MTGFGEAHEKVDEDHYSVEVRSLNNRFFKASIRLPDDIQGLEAEIDSRLRKRLTRGSITLNVKCSSTSASAAHEINLQALQAYMDRIEQLPHDAGHPIPVDIGLMLSLPGVLQPPSDLEERVDQVRPILMRLVDKACNGLIDMRAKEGAFLLADLHGHREEIHEHLNVISERTPAVVEEYHLRLRQRIETLVKDVNLNLEENDLLREIAIHAEKSDISEEISRLSAHMTQFEEIIDREPVEPVGRTLDFLAQEMLREANTIASKCNDAPISREIVVIKGAIDRIKEQVQNAE